MFWSISNKCDFYREFLSWYFLKMLFYSTHYRAHASFIMALFISTHLYNNFALSFLPLSVLSVSDLLTYMAELPIGKKRGMGWRGNCNELGGKFVKRQKKETL